MMSNLTTERKGNLITVTRTFDVTRELIFEVHSKCKHLMNWHGGEEWPLSECEMDFREGGRWSYCFKMQEEEPCGLAIYKEISRPGKISKELPTSLITLEFTEENGKTTIVNRWEYPTDSDLDLMLEIGAIEGLTEIWDRLEDYLKLIHTKDKNEEND